MTELIYDITIIIPCYNCCQYVDETMKSLFNQTYSFNRMEILLINDGSSDNTLEFIEKYEADNVKIINKKNEGVSATRNLGLKLARGRYILFLDPDDYISKNAISLIVDFFDHHYEEIDLITYPLLYFYPTGRTMEHQRYKNCYEKGTSVYDLNEYYYLVQPTINVCIKNTKEAYFDASQSYSEDEYFNTKILMNKKKIGFVKEATYYYRRHNQSITSKREQINLEKIYRFYDELLDTYNCHPFIQAIIMNNYNWRLREECLYPNNIENKDIEDYLLPITKRLAKIDFSLFKNHVLDNKNTFYDLLALSKKSCKVIKVNEKYQLLCDSKILDDNIQTNIYINSIFMNNDTLIFNGYLQTPLYYTKAVKLYMEYVDRRNVSKISRVNLFNSLSYQKNYVQKFKINISPNNIKKIQFYIRVQNEKILLNVKPLEWCSNTKLYGKYQVRINNNIIIQQKKFFTSLVNRFCHLYNYKFQLVNLLSFFVRKGKYTNIYFGDKDSEIYKDYLNDKSINKQFYSNTLGNNYKICLLNCKRLITNKSIKVVIPFGSMREFYIQASSFQIIQK